MKRILLGLILGFLMFSGISFAEAVYLMPDSTYEKNWFESGCSVEDYTCIDETPASTSDYLYRYGGGPNTRGSYGFEDLPEDADTVKSIGVEYYARGYTAANFTVFRHIIPVLYTNGGWHYGTMFSTLGSWQYYSEGYRMNPVTEDRWTVDEVNNLVAGMTPHWLNGGGKVAQMKIYVEYTT